MTGQCMTLDEVYDFWYKKMKRYYMVVVRDETTYALYLVWANWKSGVRSEFGQFVHGVRCEGIHIL